MGNRVVVRYRTGSARRQKRLSGTPFHRYMLEDDTVWTEFHRKGGGYLMRFPELADFEVSGDGTEVIAWPDLDTDDATLEHLYVNQALPLALSRQGRPTFHASVVRVAGGAVAFMGESGMGKSTLAASFALNGAPFLSDDALLLEETSEGCRVSPGHASLRLWDDSKAALLESGCPEARAISYSGKSRVLAGEALDHETGVQPLLAAYVLQAEAAAGIEIGALQGSNRHMAWIHNSFLLDIEDPELLGQHFDWTHRIACRVPTFALDYPRDYGILPELRTTLQLHAASAGC